MSSLPDVRDGKDVLASWVWLDSGSSGGLRARDVGEEIWCCLLAIVPALEALEMKREWMVLGQGQWPRFGWRQTPFHFLVMK